MAAFKALLVMAILACTEAQTPLIVILLDGFRWNYFSPELKGFDRFIANGVQADYMVPDFPSVSYPNYYSIMTGLHVESHGMVDNYMFDPVYFDVFYSGLRLDGTVATDAYWWDGGDPMWISATRQNRSSRMYFWPGCEAKIRGLNPSFCRPYYDMPQIHDLHWSIDDSMDAIENGTLQFAGIYVELTDKIAHRYGPNSEEIKETVRQVDSEISHLLARLQQRHLQDKVNIMIVSDHGMSYVAPENTINTTHYIDPADTIAIIGGNTIAGVLPVDGLAEKIYNQLQGAHPHLKVYWREDLPDLFHYKSHYRIAPIIIFADEGWKFVTPLAGLPTFNNGTRIEVGNHGYDPYTYPNMRGIFLATGPAFRSGHKAPPIHAVDVYQLMCHVTNIRASPNNGTWSKVTNMLQTSGSDSLPIMTFTTVLLIIVAQYLQRP